MDPYQFTLRRSISIPIQLSVDQFFTSVSIWILKPQVVNRWLTGSKVVFSQFSAKTNSTNSSQDSSNDSITASQLVELVPAFYRDFVQRVLKEENVEFLLRQLFPKKVNKYAGSMEMVIKDYTNQQCTFIPWSSSVDGKPSSSLQCVYSFRFNKTTQCIELFECPSLSSSSPALSTTDNNHAPTDLDFEWIESKLLPKIVNWSLASIENIHPSSLLLVPVDEYSHVYQMLKDKYGKKFVESWTESTDPQKFVYEDIGIAAYLLLLWEKERVANGDVKKQTFVDLGCGNGLLVHILNSEGYVGVGVDIRRRQIWSTYGDETALEEYTVVPDDARFGEYDWLIGNHSDELTPWIPVMAARHSKSQNVFILPCCPFDFFSKFNQRQQADASSYDGYLKYVQLICETSGFRVGRDKLRIPSTKRACFVGWSQERSEEERAGVLEGIEQLIGKAERIKSAEAVAEFVPRKEAVWKNHLSADVSEQLRRSIFDLIVKEDPTACVQIGGGREWKCGGRLDVHALMAAVPSDLKERMKCFGNGVNSFLKQYAHLFQMTLDKDTGRCMVGLNASGRRPSVAIKRGSKKINTSTAATSKTKPCWFHVHHPDGCPLSADECQYLHCTSVDGSSLSDDHNDRSVVDV